MGVMKIGPSMNWLSIKKDTHTQTRTQVYIYNSKKMKQNKTTGMERVRAIAIIYKRFVFCVYVGDVEMSLEGGAMEPGGVLVSMNVCGESRWEIHRRRKERKKHTGAVLLGWRKKNTSSQIEGGCIYVMEISIYWYAAGKDVAVVVVDCVSTR